MGGLGSGHGRAEGRTEAAELLLGEQARRGLLFGCLLVWVVHRVRQRIPQTI